ncbi:MAG TPA: hypothetical protein VNI02_09355 [Blastocatellia bacterium]|jgi:hypothetical protein|nr:hypothetical protein [Blastocatellia bacterium]
MKRILPSGIFVAIFALACGQAMSFSGGVAFLFTIPGIAPDIKADAGGDRVNRIERAEKVERWGRGAEFVMSKFDRLIIKEFSRAWRNSGNGTTDSESVVLIFRMIDGGYLAKSLGATNEHRKFTFKWHPGAIAVVHTHPNNADPRPQEADCQIADKYGVPIFTITIAGMFVYDPYTKKITRVQDGLNWLELSSWPRKRADNNG